MGGAAKKTACVTGGNGYIASALVQMLLEKGYAVKTTVRNPGDTEKNGHLMELQALGPLEILRADLDDEGSFDDAVAGCDYAFLVAAPVNITTPENPEKEQIEPSVRGTLNVMRSCAKARGAHLGGLLRLHQAAGGRRQCAGRGLLVRPGLRDRREATSLVLAHTAAALQAYVVSKVLSEKEACRFAQEHGISLVILCPGLTVGASPAPKVYSSVPAGLSILSGDEAALATLKGIESSFGAVPIVDLLDLCRAEVLLAETEAASGSSGDELLEKPRVSLSSAKLVKYHTLHEIYQDVVEYGKALGIVFIFSIDYIVKKS